jgi:preprotein translocase subunit Sec61beta
MHAVKAATKSDARMAVNSIITSGFNSAKLIRYYESPEFVAYKGDMKDGIKVEIARMKDAISTLENSLEDATVTEYKRSQLEDFLNSPPAIVAISAMVCALIVAIIYAAFSGFVLSVEFIARIAGL